MIADGTETLTALEWAKCIHPKGKFADLIPIIENSDLLSNSDEQITFLECIQRARDLQGWLARPETGPATA
jgi:hypothetical protein